MAKKKPTVCGEVQRWLFDYLSTEIDPYDFSMYVDEFLDEVGWAVDRDEGVNAMTEAQLGKFTTWLRKTNKAEEYLRFDPVEAPAYLTLRAEAKLPEGSWLIHFTDASDVSSFKYGITLEGLALSRHKPDKVKVDCAKNLSDQIGAYEVVFGFAFDADLKRVDAHSRKYGRNAVLFQSDCALTAWHDGDEESQAIFPLCSEYNLLMLHDVRDGLTVYTADDEAIEFKTIAEVIDYVERGEDRTLGGVRLPRLRRLR